MRVELDFTISVQENADRYYALAKKSRKKLDGLAKGAEEIRRKMSQQAKAPLQSALVRKKERRWFEKFRWCRTSEGLLVVAGRDAKGNEQVVKKVMADDDLYFHADIHGAAHTVLKCEGKRPGAISKQEAAIFAAVCSKAWQEQIPAIDVYSVTPSQVSKSAPSGESIGTGAFMVYGGREWFKKTPLEYAGGVRHAEGAFEVFAGPPSSVRSMAQHFVGVGFGSASKGEAAKLILKIFSSKAQKKIGLGIDDIIPLLPTGGLQVSAIK